MVHAAIIAVTGKPPDRLEWRRPKLMEETAARMAESAERVTDVVEEAPEGEDDGVWLPAGYSPSWDEPVAPRSR
jgi:hypothetical protein